MIPAPRLDQLESQAGGNLPLAGLLHAWGRPATLAAWGSDADSAILAAIAALDLDDRGTNLAAGMRFAQGIVVAASVWADRLAPSTVAAVEALKERLESLPLDAEAVLALEAAQAELPLDPFDFSVMAAVVYPVPFVHRRRQRRVLKLVPKAGTGLDSASANERVGWFALAAASADAPPVLREHIDTRSHDLPDNLGIVVRTLTADWQLIISAVTCPTTVAVRLLHRPFLPDPRMPGLWVLALDHLEMQVRLALLADPVVDLTLADGRRLRCR